MWCWTRAFPVTSSQTRHKDFCTNPSTKLKFFFFFLNEALVHMRPLGCSIGQPVHNHTSIFILFSTVASRVLRDCHPPERGFRCSCIFNKLALRHMCTWPEFCVVVVASTFFSPFISVCLCCWLWPEGCTGPNELCSNWLASFQTQHPGSICLSALMRKHTQRSLGPLC